MEFRRQFFELPLSEEKKQQADALAEKLEERFHFRYRHKELEGLYAKTTVSELKRSSMEEREEGVLQWYGEEEIIPYIPGFLQQQKSISGTSGTQRGSAYHKVLELLPFTGTDSAEALEKALQEAEEKVLTAANDLFSSYNSYCWAVQYGILI